MQQNTDAMRCRKAAGRERHLGCGAQEDCRKRKHHGDLQYSERHHRLAPAEMRDDGLEDRGPDRAGHVGAARDERERRAAVAIKPLAYIHIEGGIHAADAKNPHEQPLAEIELPSSPESRERKTCENHQRPEHGGPSHSHLFRNGAHHDPACAHASPGKRACQGRDRAQSAHLRRNGLERNNGDPWPAKRECHDDQHHARDGP